MTLSRRLPFPLGERLAGASASLYNRQGREFDVAIGGIPFMLATMNDLPQSIETIGIRKDQFDVEDPGEQSLTGWWRRSQASFHFGAGFTYAEDSTKNTDTPGFHDSEGVDPFVVGQISLLHKMQLSAIAAGGVYSRLRSFFSAGAVSYGAISNGALHTAPAASGTFASVHAPAGKTLVDALVTNGNFYDVASDGTLYGGLLASPGTATTWPLGGTPSRLGFGKHRLWVIGGRSIWQPDLSAAGGTSQTPIFTSPDTGWTYTCMAEGPSAMYFGGNNGFNTSIQAITFDASGSIPSLSGAAVTVVLPDGELVQEIAVLGGQFIGIGTSQGFRIGVINSDASITYGPLTVAPEGVTACTSLATQGHFFVVGFKTAAEGSVVYRVDTSTQIADGVFPYAKGVRCSTGNSVTSLTTAGNQVVCTTDDGRVHYEDPSTYVDSGWLETGRIRFRTNEPKTFRYLEVTAEPLAGSIACSVIKEGGSALPIGSFTQQGDIPVDPLAVNATPMREVAIRFDLSPNSGTPVIHSYLVRALPAVAPQRLITVPLRCFDREQAKSGQRYGADGYARDRLTALMLLEDAAETLIYQDFNRLLGANSVVIESLKFAQTSPPDGANGPGGIIILQLRTVDK